MNSKERLNQAIIEMARDLADIGVIDEAAMRQYESLQIKRNNPEKELEKYQQSEKKS